MHVDKVCIVEGEGKAYKANVGVETTTDAPILYVKENVGVSGHCSIVDSHTCRIVEGHDGQVE